MELTPLLAGLVWGLALSVARQWAEQKAAGRADRSELFPDRDVVTAFIVLGTTANVYSALLIASGAPQVYARPSALVALALVTASQLLIFLIALRPSRLDLDLALAASAPYVYLAALWIVAQALGAYTLWLF
ncbi:MAG: hypothetical protein RXQ56_09915 [Thermoproteus sp.]|jgi:hypothetical protein